MRKVGPLFLTVILIFSAGMYGCTQQKSNPINSKLRDMETRFAKLEEDYQALVANLEASRKKLAQTEAEKKVLVQEVTDLRPVVQERDELRKQLVARTGERDQYQTQLTQFKQELQTLVSRVDAALKTPGGGPAVPAVPASRKS